MKSLISLLRSIIWISLFAAVYGCDHPKIIEMPLNFDEERKLLSIEYLKKRHGIDQDHPYINPAMVVIHWTAIPTLDLTYKAFESSRLPGTRAAISGASDLNVSAHYLVDRDGSIYRLLPDTVFARHCIGLNYCAIGIENVGDGKDNPLTEEQLKANHFLVKKLAGKYPIEYLIGHHEYQRFRTTEIWKETDPDYLTFKTDPGDEFMLKLRTLLKPLNLKGAP
ncbi:MAG: N-acetylmuramoyl-L-alanine amidase [Cyclobacteriaceae bacterium]|nr:N-acetylmuramoyl-L-alanine amidase [Cyclobacteriaceae bacterium]